MSVTLMIVEYTIADFRICYIFDCESDKIDFEKMLQSVIVKLLL